MDTAIQKANDKIGFLAKDREAMRQYELREMALSDYTSGINNARREGEFQRGIEIAKSLLKDNFDINFIIKHTGLDESIIKQLQTELDTE